MVWELYVLLFCHYFCLAFVIYLYNLVHFLQIIIIQTNENTANTVQLFTELIQTIANNSYNNYNVKDHLKHIQLI